MQNRIEPVLRLGDLVEIFRVSVPTVHRWLREARRGKNNFPMPISTPGRVLIWNKNEIETFLSGKSQPVNEPRVEPPSKRQKRHKAAMSELEQRHGVKIKTQ